jgi:hypothetical protein
VSEAAAQILAATTGSYTRSRPICTRRSMEMSPSLGARSPNCQTKRLPAMPRITTHHDGKLAPRIHISASAPAAAAASNPV